MKISQFMNQALFDKDQGYYRTKNPIGKDYDFITAPEISQVFGEIVAAYLLQIFTTKNCAISLVEMGAGRGTFFKDILNSIKKLANNKNPCALSFLDFSSFHIIEINPVLQKEQQKSLSDFNVKWHENFIDFFAEIKEQKSEIFFISNELFDCFAIDQFVLTESGWRERIVLDKKFTLAKFDQKIHDFVESKINGLAPIGAVFEYSTSAQEFMQQLCQILKAKGGIAINFDYGYIKNEFINSLQAVKNHNKVDILQNAPQCDITALVDFLALDKIVKNNGLNSSLITQGEFLRSLGVEERRAKLIAQNQQKAIEINSAIDRLIDSAQMGELFKCHIIWR